MATSTTSWEATAYFHPDPGKPRGLGTLREAVYLFMMTAPGDRQQAYVICPEPVLIDGVSHDAETKIGREDLEKLVAILVGEHEAARIPSPS